MRTGLKSMLPSYGELELAQGIGAIVPGTPSSSRRYRAGTAPRFPVSSSSSSAGYPVPTIRSVSPAHPSLSSSIRGASKQPEGSQVLGPAPFPPSWRQGQPSPGYFPASTPGYYRAYPPAQAYRPSFSVQQYGPIFPHRRRQRKGRGMRRLSQLLMMAKRSGYRHWKVRNMRGKWVSRISPHPHPQQRSPLTRQIARLRRSINRKGHKRSVRLLVRRIMGNPIVVGPTRRAPSSGVRGFSTPAYWGALGNVGIGPGMF